MMKVLIVKTSSLGDVIHLLPALSDAQKIYPDIQFDWVVEESFSEIPRWHPAVKKVIPVALRRWRKQLFSSNHRKEWKNFYRALREQSYELVIDAQGLMKSAGITFLSRGTRAGLDWNSAWEPLASLAYQKKCAVNPDQHAITRMRQLMASALGYEAKQDVPEYGIDRNRFESYNTFDRYIVFLHGTSAPEKYWPKKSWIALANQVIKEGYQVLLPWGNAEESQRAQEIAAASGAQVLPQSNLAQMASILNNAKGIVAVDTGLGHLSAALNIPTVSLYLCTDPRLIGTMGKHQLHLDGHLSADEVWKQFQTKITNPQC